MAQGSNKKTAPEVIPINIYLIGTLFYLYCITVSLNMLQDLLIPLITVGCAELGDKTQLSVLLLSIRTKNHIQLLVGVILAFLIVDGIAILTGSWIINLVPRNVLKIIASLTFIIMGVIILFHIILSVESV